jgi:hypothetical protein
MFKRRTRGKKYFYIFSVKYTHGRENPLGLKIWIAVYIDQLESKKIENKGIIT